MKKITIAALAAAAVALGGCVTTQEQARVIVREQVVVMPPEELFRQCRALRQADFPDPRTMTEVELARLLVEANRRGLNCESSVNEIREFLREAKRKIESGKKKKKGRR